MTTTSIDAFDRTTARWGRGTLFAGLIISLSGPMYLMFGLGYWPGLEPVAHAWLAVAILFGVIWVLEPVTYYPMLGQAPMYQAFMIGNILNKLLPSALSAQQALGAKPGTKKAEIAAATAITGAATVHLASLLVLVGFLGTWVVSIVPSVVHEAFAYIIPAIFGPVLVQAVLTSRQRRTTVIALGCGGLGATVMLLLSPDAAPLGMGVFVIASVVLSILLRTDKTTTPPAEPKADEKAEAST
jgi:hypothetical protein